MGDIIYKQQTSIQSGKLPVSGGSNIIEKDFEIHPPVTLEIVDFNENTSHRFSIPANSIDFNLCTGTVNEIKVLVLKPESNLEVKFINSNGTSPNITFFANRISIMHVSITGILVTNNTSVPIKGVLFIAGD